MGLGQAETESEYMPAKCKLMSVLVEGKEIRGGRKRQGGGRSGSG